VIQVQTNVFVLQHGETDVGGAAAMFPMLWDDDLLAITGMLEQPFKPGTQQENLMLITGDNTTEVRPWRKLLSSTGNGSMWWPAARTIPTDRFPSMIGGVVVVAESTRALPVATWNALSDLSVRDRKIIVLTGTESCKLPRARGWDIYRPNLNVCDDTLRRYILFNSPTQNLPRVAVIEDDILMRKLLVSTIEDQAQIVEMGSVQEALTNLRTMAFDVILLDLFLPDGSGLEILKAIQSDSRLIKARSTPIVALTGSSDLELNQTVLNEGATEVLVKPMPMQVLRQKIAVLTRQNRSRRLSGPVATQPAAAATTANTPAVTEPDLPVVPAAPRRLAGMSKIISLRALAAASSQAQPVARECAVGD
jgi:CheY-like chemotaxis protein